MAIAAYLQHLDEIDEIAKKVGESCKAREQSNTQLEIAKTGVKRAMRCQRGYANETDEATTTTWINEQLKALR